ncbi:low complexity protein [Moumouvirus goulette]|uniref:Low complexity protein n=1 Tax=Moumouvirus goulette TaxID=1247379 RepID=M1PMR7_9VIRU|nr:low complexity protein [Moumouvirus goulette]AGF85271.1 low complexity protein [Moumouvirus goulette]
MEFDLLCDKVEETILPILGFRDKIDKYKQNTSYTGSVSYNLDIDKIYFSLSGTSMEPIEIEPDKEISLNKIVKKSRIGLMLKHLILNFKNDLDQYYDFDKKFKICLKITYANN